ncbi:tRNA-uridine aminocarboxypropyltransferase [Thalassotalea crassostreae]|uniref:tRNA-uridine aminocarboxypropyltransferase n=1 Tax=Thalassotalea crassostreae TaxID=1763536 RepID=UPI0008385C52|nr:DTW domain-containing protein [Thalassotalea crassostreae]
MHAVHKLYQIRKSISTREFKARGAGVKRCEQCRIDQRYCICSMVKQSPCNAAFLLLMFDDEVLKPSNTGRLIADVIPDTHAFIWQRTQVSEQLQLLLEDEKYQPYIIFPEQYAMPGQVVFTDKPQGGDDGKTPLFIVIDATWRQAKKIFRKSPYLHHLPLLSFTNNGQGESSEDSRYHVRKTVKEGHLATAEVASKALAMFGFSRSAGLLDRWFDVFSYRYQKWVMQANKGDENAIDNYQAFIAKEFR